MDQFDEIESRLNKSISELADILKQLQSDIGNNNKAISFEQVKKIEESIIGMKREKIPVPEELIRLKIDLISKHENHKARITLYQKIQEALRGLINQPVVDSRKGHRIIHPKPTKSTTRKPYNYQKPLGSKGFNNLENYLIPVIKLMWDGLDHKTAFHKTAKILDVRYNTVSAQCTRSLELTTEQFNNYVKSKEIVSLLEIKYPEGKYLIDSQLK